MGGSITGPLIFIPLKHYLCREFLQPFDHVALIVSGSMV
jgi:hypothetical protein